MKKIKFSISFIIFACLMTGIGLFSSCSKDDNIGGSSNELLSFGPTGAQLGDTITFIGNGLDKVTKIVFVGDSVSQSEFISQTSTIIKLIVPPNAQKGYVILRNSNGTSVTSLTMINFLIPAMFSDVTPLPAKPGTNITITGEHLDWATSVEFFNNAGNITVTDTFFVSQSATQIVVTVPMNAQRGPLVVHTAGTKPLAITMTDFPVILPTITDFSPNLIAGGKDQLTINGTDLDLVQGILLKGPGMDTIKTFVSQTPTQIVIAPPVNTAPGPITIIPYSNLPVVSSNSLSVVLPAITDLSPNPVERGGLLTVTGTNLDLVTGVVMLGADTIKTFVSQSATQLVLTVPDGAKKGPITIVSAPLIPIASNNDLTYVGDPTNVVLMIFDFDEKTASSWGVGACPSPNDDGPSGNFYEVTEDTKANGSWQWGFANNSAAFYAWLPQVAGLSGYALKMDVRLRDDIPVPSGGWCNLQFALTQSATVNIEGYLTQGSVYTTGGDWKTITIPLSSISGLSDPTPTDGNWGLIFNEGSGAVVDFVGLCIDNVRYESITN